MSKCVGIKQLFALCFLGCYMPYEKEG
jgi:hypothetical protein